MMTSEPPQVGGSQSLDRLSTSYAAASPANHSAPQDSETEQETCDGGGRGWQTSFAQYDLDTSSWRTLQLSLMIETPSDGCSVTWPTSGSMRNGTCYARPTLARPTAVSGSISWPTPRATMSRIKVQPRPQRPGATNLEEAVYHWTGEHGGYLNPRWIEWLMGFPSGWCEIPSTHLGTP